jgi:hypothetical protein
MLPHKPKPGRNPAINKACNHLNLALGPALLDFIVFLFHLLLITALSFYHFPDFLHTRHRDWHQILYQELFTVFRQLQTSLVMVWKIFKLAFVINRMEVFFTGYNIGLKKVAELSVAVQLGGLRISEKSFYVLFQKWLLF